VRERVLLFKSCFCFSRRVTVASSSVNARSQREQLPERSLHVRHDIFFHATYGSHLACVARKAGRQAASY
jgi:hypothetical protein